MAFLGGWSAGSRPHLHMPPCQELGGASLAKASCKVYFTGGLQPQQSRYIGSSRWTQRQKRIAALPPTAKMHVPSDSFGGRSPERKAADALQNLFTWCALQVVLSQLGAGGEGGDLPPTRAYMELMEFLEDNPMTSGDEWVAKLMIHNQMLGVRVMEVREAYSAEDFDWKECRQLARKGIQEANVRLLRQYAAEKFAGALTNQPQPPLSPPPPGVEGK